MPVSQISPAGTINADTTCHGCAALIMIGTAAVRMEAQPAPGTDPSTAKVRQRFFHPDCVPKTPPVPPTP